MSDNALRKKRSCSFIFLWILAVFFMPLLGFSVELESVPGLKIGEIAPDFTTVSQDGSIIELSNLYQTGPVVLIFYRGAWCPYCNLHLQQFQLQIEKFDEFNARVIAISVDLQEYAQKTAMENRLAFDVIGNPSMDILEAYGLVFEVPEDLRSKYLNEYSIDLEAYSGRDDGKIAIPATYVIDQNGQIIFAYASKDYKARTHPDEVLQVLKKHYRSEKEISY